jgi:hypothetical protein
MQFVYHAVPRHMTGEVIYPLNELALVDAALYEFQRAKYVGREAAMDFHLPRLDLLFNDVVHCAPVHPHRLFAARRAVGFDPPSRPGAGWLTGLFFRIPVERILINKVVWYSCKTLWISGAPSQNVPLTAPSREFEPFNSDRYHELHDVTPAHLAYLRHTKRHGLRPLGFVHIPHILVAGPIDVSGLDPIPWDEPPTAQPPRGGPPARTPRTAAIPKLNRPAATFRYPS